MAASDLLDALEQRGRSSTTPGNERPVRACRGLICAEQGNAEEARRAFGTALDEHDHTSTPLDRARTLLALGRLQRRLHAKRDSRSSLEEALDIFDALGSPRWAEQARTELQRIGGRAQSRDALTPTESRVAELAAQGLTNKEIAAELVVTVKSVEAHLTRIYAKLGIRSRTRLTRRLSQQRK
jgi:DNA-binding CsgD family transcriptional regulator